MRRERFALLALLALSTSALACGTLLGAAEDPPLNPPAGDGGASDDALSPIETEASSSEQDADAADGDAGPCRATGTAAVDPTYGAAAAFPFPVTAAAVTSSGDVYGVASQVCADAGSTRPVLARIQPNGVVTGPLGCIGADGESARGLASTPSGLLLATSLFTTRSTVRLWRVQSDGAATILEDYQHIVSPPDSRSPFATVTFQVGASPAWGGFLQLSAGTPRLKGTLRVRIGAGWKQIALPVPAEVPVAAAVRGNQVIIALVAESASPNPAYMILRRWNLTATTLVEDLFATGLRTKFDFTNDPSVTFGSPVTSILWSGDTVTVAVPNGPNGLLLVAKETGPLANPSAFSTIGGPRLARACDDAILAATTITGGVDVLRFGPDGGGWGGPTPRITNGSLVAFGAADDGFAYVVSSSKAARLTP